MNFSQEVKRVTLAGKKKLDKKLIVFHGHFLFCHGQNFRNCHGHFSFFTGTFLAILSRATRHFSRAKFGVFCHGHFSKVTGTFSKNFTGKPKSFTGKKKNTGVGSFGSLHFEIFLKPHTRKKLHRALKRYSSASYHIFWVGMLL